MSPAAQVRCDALNAVAAQEAYFVAHRIHYSGPCAELPGFAPTAGVLCTTIGGDFSYVVTTSGTNSIISCVYNSLPAAGTQKLTCG